MNFDGVYCILTSPFLEDGKLDLRSLRKLTDAVIDTGVDGITVLGVAGEAQRLAEAERRRVVETVMDSVAGRVPVVVGTSYDGTDNTIEASRSAERAGARGVMVAPPTFLQPGAQLTKHYSLIADSLDIPIVLQDYPPVNGVTLPPQAIADLVTTVPLITTIKLEDVPTANRIAQTKALCPSGVSIVGGLGGLYFLDELRNGSSGTMTGFSYPEVFVNVWRAWSNADFARATEVFYRFLPLIAFEGQPRIGLAIRKELLRRRGWIRFSTVRHPGPTMDQSLVRDLESLDSIVTLNR